MAGRQVLSLRDPRASIVEESSQRGVDHDLSNIDGYNSRQRETGRKRACVLLGAAISQLPIWGFAMNYGIFQEYYTNNWTLQGSQEITGIIGTTSNGVMYLSMPLFFALFTRSWAHHRQRAAIAGAVLACASFLLSSFSTHGWHLVATQGILAALGCALIYSTTTLSLGEWFKSNNRAVAYGITLSCKNVVGSACPFLLRALLDLYGFRTTLRILAAIVAGSSIVAILLVPTPPSGTSANIHRAPKIPWHFLRHRMFHVHSIAIILQSCGYGIPQTYLGSYAHDIALVSQTSATLLLTLFNIPGIVASSFFGYLSDNKIISLSATRVTFIPAVCSAASAFLFWGLTYEGSLALLVLFSVTFGFAAGGYSATWGGVLKELETDAAQRDEAIDMGMVYGLLNGARGVGYVTGGLIAIPLLRAGSTTSDGKFGYDTLYGPLIIFTGISSAFGGWGVLWR